MKDASPFLANAWYCAAFSNELQSQPLGRTFLDQAVVMWRSPEGEVRAVGGVCPHRFASLATGKLVADTLACPYHGLKFDGSGACVHNPHGSGTIPPRAAIPTYTVFERQGIVWIWMGAGKPDEAAVPNLPLAGADDNPRVDGHLLMKADYRLIIDNLLDLNHAPYLHAGTLSPNGSTRETRSERGAASAASRYLMRSVHTPASQQLWFEEEFGDYHVDMEWAAPSNLYQRIAMTSVDADPDSGALTKGAHLLTPETAVSTHYFWLMTRNRRVEDKDADTTLKRIIENAFLAEDGPMMEACQRNMRGRDFADLRPIFLETDAAPAHARSVLARLISDQTN